MTCQSQVIFQIIFNLYVLIGVICDGDLYFCNKMKNFRKFAKIFLRLLSFLSIKPTIYCGFSAIGPVECKKISIINYPHLLFIVVSSRYYFFHFSSKCRKSLNIQHPDQGRGEQPGGIDKC